MLIPIVAVSDIFDVKLVTPKNCVNDFDVYETNPVVVSSYVTYSSPVLPNPTVESTSMIVDPAETFPITLVDASTTKFPYTDPSTPTSLLYPPSYPRR